MSEMDGSPFWKSSKRIGDCERTVVVGTAEELTAEEMSRLEGRVS